MPLHKALFIEPNPAGAKYALSLLGQIERRRAPAAGHGRRSRPRKAIRAAMEHAGLIN